MTTLRTPRLRLPARREGQQITRAEKIEVIKALVRYFASFPEGGSVLGPIDPRVDRIMDAGAVRAFDAVARFIL